MVSYFFVICLVLLDLAGHCILKFIYRDNLRPRVKLPSSRVALHFLCQTPEGTASAG